VGSSSRRRTDLGGRVSPELRRIRRSIDAVDQILSAALALRAGLVVRAALLPGKRRDRIREAEILAAAARRPTGGLRPAAVRRIFRAIIDAGIELQADCSSAQARKSAALHDRPASSRSARSLVVKKR
jgi:chorismate mutase